MCGLSVMSFSLRSKIQKKEQEIASLKISREEQLEVLILFYLTSHAFVGKAD